MLTIRYFNAAQILMANGVDPVGIASATTTPWATAGLPDVLASVAHVSIGAFRAAWFQKYGVHMRIRPEVYAQRLDLAFRRDDLLDAVPGLRRIKEHFDSVPDLLQMVRDHNVANGGDGSLLLNLQYAEGSPTHPSLPAGHATVAGACATVLKAMLQTFVDNNPLRPRTWLADGRTVLVVTEDDRKEAYRETDVELMTVNGEINKLASNIAFGRDWAGVHYRADAEAGMRLGEEYAITYLLAKVREYSQNGYGFFDGWLLEKLDGSVVRISNEGVEPA